MPCSYRTQAHTRIDALVNNAGIMVSARPTLCPHPTVLSLFISPSQRLSPPPTASRANLQYVAREMQPCISPSVSLYYCNTIVLLCQLFAKVCSGEPPRTLLSHTAAAATAAVLRSLSRHQCQQHCSVESLCAPAAAASARGAGLCAIPVRRALPRNVAMHAHAEHHFLAGITTTASLPTCCSLRSSTRALTRPVESLHMFSILASSTLASVATAVSPIVCCTGCGWFRHSTRAFDLIQSCWLQVGAVFNKSIPQGAATTVHCVVAAQEEQRGTLPPT